MTTTHLSPPRWPLALLRVVLPRDSMGDAILGDLHEELTHDAARLGIPTARLLYAGRASSILGHALVDTMRRRRWASVASAAAWPEVARASVATPEAARRPNRAPVRARAAGSGAALAAAVFGVLTLGIAANMALYSAAHGTTGPVPHAGSTLNTTFGIGAIVLSIVSAGAAAVLLCAGPRWLRRRLRHA